LREKGVLNHAKIELLWKSATSIRQQTVTEDSRGLTIGFVVQIVQVVEVCWKQIRQSLQLECGVRAERNAGVVTNSESCVRWHLRHLRSGQ
jgi:hypothetical protein